MQAQAKKAKPGAIARMVADLLLSPKTLEYAAIAERVRKRIPEARTSARSVASIASALRAGGHDVPDRRASH